MGRRRGARAPVGVLFSGGVDSVAVLACCLRLDIPVVAATAAFTGSLAEPSDLTPARTAAAAMGARLLVEEVNATDERRAAAALARIAPAVYGMDVVKAGVALTTYFAAKACAAEGCCAVFSGGGSEELLAGYARHAASTEDEKVWVSRVCARCTTEIYSATTPPRVCGASRCTTRSYPRTSPPSRTDSRDG